MDKKSLLAALREKIAQAESKGDYNAYNQGRAVPKSGKIASLTLEELMKRQALAKGDANRVFAAGKYQMIPDTLKEAVSKLKLDTKEKFSPEMQEKLFDYLIQQKRPAIGQFIEGKGTPEEASMALAKEWASMPVLADTERNGKPVKRGESYYSGIGGNKAKVSPEALESLLKQYKTMKSPVAPVAEQDPIKQEQDAAFEKMLSQPQVPMIAGSDNNFADGGFEETDEFLKNLGIAAGAQNSNVFPYRPEEPEQADDIAQTRETGLPEQTKALEMPDVDTSIPDPFESKIDQAPIVQPEELERSNAENVLNRIMELRKKQKEETDKEYADKESSAKWKDIAGKALGGLDKAFAHYGAANPNAILKPVHLEQEKQDRLEKVQGEKAETLKDREKVIEDIMSQELKSASKSALSNDPSSMESMRAREVAKQFLGKDVPADSTELQLSKVLPTLLATKRTENVQEAIGERQEKGLGFQKEKADRPSDKQVEKFESLKFTEDLVNQIDSEMASMEENLGPYASRLESAKEFVPGMNPDPDFMAFKSNLVEQLASYIKDKSGAQVSDTERRFLQGALPSVTDKPSSFKAKMDEFRKRLAMVKDGRFKTIEAQGKDLSKMKDVFGESGETSEAPKSEFSPAQEAGINKVMQNNNISREQAVEALKKAGKL